MNRDIITSALDAEGKRVHINEAESRGRYRGATQHHQDCELYPVFRKTKRSSFAHVPNPPDACGRGESAVHREACEGWMRFFESQLNGCAVCLTRGIEPVQHVCPAVRFQDGRWMEASAGRPIYGEIVWTCGKCLRVHMWDLLDGTVRAISNKRVPSLGSRVRPDITLLGRDDNILAFLEFRRSHLSNAVRDIAEDRGIPLFIVDIENSLTEFQTGLNNPRRGIWDSIAPSEINRKMDETAFRFQECVGKEGGMAGSFCAAPDANGDLAHVVFHAVGKSSALPGPSLGGYLVAGESSLPCESQNRWIAPLDA